MGQTDVKRYKAMAESFKAAIWWFRNRCRGGGGPQTVVDTQINQVSGLTSKDGVAQPIVIEGLPKVPSSSGSQVANKLSTMLGDSKLSSEVSLQNNIEGVLLSLSEKLLFTPGTVELGPQAYPVLDSIAAMAALWIIPFASLVTLMIRRRLMRSIRITGSFRLPGKHDCSIFSQ